MSLVEDLKQRKLVQWALAYGAGAWLVLQLMDALDGPLGLSQRLMLGVLILLLTGFPITLVLAWYHGEQGRQRVSGPELLMISALMLIGGLALSWIGPDRQRTDSAEAGQQQLTAREGTWVAVLPFDNLSPDPDDEYFANGMQSQITAALARVPELSVIPRTSVRQYREHMPPASQIARELDVDYLVEGSARVSSGRFQLDIRVIDAGRDGEGPLWAWEGEVSAERLYEVQGDVARQVAFAVGTSISPLDREQIGRVMTDSTRAFLLYLRASEEFARERSGDAQFDHYASVDLFESAVAADPAFALARAGLALTLSYTNPESGREDRTRREAVAALPLPEAKVALARYYAAKDSAEEALLTLEAVMLDNPRFALALLELGSLQREVGRFDEGMRTLERAVEMDPRNPLVHGRLAESYLFAHRHADALRTLRTLEELGQDPVHTRAWTHLAMGDIETGRRLVEEAYERRPTAFYNIHVLTEMGLLRTMLAPEQRRLAFDRYYATRPDYYLPCDDIRRACFRRAVYEDEAGNEAVARVYWDSLRTVLDERPLGYVHRNEPVIHLAVGDTTTAMTTLATMLGPTDGVYTKRRFSLVPQIRFLEARLLLAAGREDEAIAVLEEILPAPSNLSVAILEVDPLWDPLRKNSRFQRLLEAHR